MGKGERSEGKPMLGFPFFGICERFVFFGLLRPKEYSDGRRKTKKIKFPRLRGNFSSFANPIFLCYTQGVENKKKDGCNRPRI